MYRSMLVMCAVVVTGCFQAPEDFDRTPGPQADQVPSKLRPMKSLEVLDQPDGCDRTKLTFERSQACWNDGWLELCASRSGGAALVGELRRIAPTIFISDVPMGRVGCNPATELSAIYTYDRATACNSDGATMSATAWATVCQLSAVQGTRVIAAGFGE